MNELKAFYFFFVRFKIVVLMLMLDGKEKKIATVIVALFFL